MTPEKKLVTTIDKAVIDREEKKRGGRTHLGFSMLGRECAREVWYGWRWYLTKHRFTGRILRLFQRGHDEEPRILKWLEMIGADIQPFSQQLWWSGPLDEYHLIEHDADMSGGVGSFENVSLIPYHVERAAERGVKPKQWLASDLGGHMGGSGDGNISLPSIFDLEGRGLLEFKTHGDKSFKQLVKNGLVNTKLEHVVQMQLYMHYFGLKWALYIAINKNDDHMHPEIVHYDPVMAEKYIERGRLIVGTNFPPPRISNSRTWFKCKFCDYKDICHDGAEPEKNCRSCVHAFPTEDGKWYCGKFGANLTKDIIMMGDQCPEWTQANDT